MKRAYMKQTPPTILEIITGRMGSAGVTKTQAGQWVNWSSSSTVAKRFKDGPRTWKVWELEEICKRLGLRLVIKIEENE